MRLLEMLAGTQTSEALAWTLIHSLWEGAMIAVALAALLVPVRSPRVRYAAGCVALLAMLASFAATLIYFLPAHGGGETLHKVTLPPWSPVPDWKGSHSRFPGFAILIPWLAPLWIVGVCLFYLRYAAGWL